MQALESIFLGFHAPFVGNRLPQRVGPAEELGQVGPRLGSSSSPKSLKTYPQNPSWQAPAPFWSATRKQPIRTYCHPGLVPLAVQKRRSKTQAPTQAPSREEFFTLLLTTEFPK